MILGNRWVIAEGIAFVKKGVSEEMCQYWPLNPWRHQVTMLKTKVCVKEAILAPAECCGTSTWRAQVSPSLWSHHWKRGGAVGDNRTISGHRSIFWWHWLNHASPQESTGLRRAVASRTMICPCATLHGSSHWRLAEEGVVAPIKKWCLKLFFLYPNHLPQKH